VIVDHDQTDQVRAQLAAYLAEDPALFAATRWIVIRNGEDRRTTWSVTSGDERSAYSAVEVIACENRGYGSAINRGAAVAGCRYVLASNADLLPQPGFLAAVYRLIAEMDDPAGPWNTVGIVGFRLLNEDLSEQGSVGRFRSHAPPRRPQVHLGTGNRAGRRGVGDGRLHAGVAAIARVGGRF
jgi:glycosyltransferase involved in cell wall biosynthesis